MDERVITLSPEGNPNRTPQHSTPYLKEFSKGGLFVGFDVLTSVVMKE
jgi:hypothetical protein